MVGLAEVSDLDRQTIFGDVGRKLALQKDKAGSDVAVCFSSRMFGPEKGLVVADIVDLPEHFVGGALVEPDACAHNPDVLGEVMY